MMCGKHRDKRKIQEWFRGPWSPHTPLICYIFAHLIRIYVPRHTLAKNTGLIVGRGEVAILDMLQIKHPVCPFSRVCFIQSNGSISPVNRKVTSCVWTVLKDYFPFWGFLILVVFKNYLKKYILLIMLLQLSQYFPLCPLLPGTPPSLQQSPPYTSTGRAYNFFGF